MDQREKSIKADAKKSPEEIAAEVEALHDSAYKSFNKTKAIRLPNRTDNDE